MQGYLPLPNWVIEFDLELPRQRKDGSTKQLTYQHSRFVWFPSTCYEDEIDRTI